jgi:rhodopsin domain-containing protein
MGRHVFYLSPEQRNFQARVGLFNVEFYVYTVTLVKLSIAWMLKRFMPDVKLWQQGLNILMLFLAAIAIACSCVDYTRCHPFREIWNSSSPPSNCNNKFFFGLWVYLASGMFDYNTFQILELHHIHLLTLLQPYFYSLTFSSLFFLSSFFVASEAHYGNVFSSPC